MKKLFLVLIIIFSLVSTAIASQISYDKSNFRPVSSVIYDAAYDTRYYSGNNLQGIE